MSKIPVSVVVIMKNEEHNVDACLSSVKDWANEIIVVDDMSTDNTVELCQKYTDRVLTRKMDNEGTHRNWAYEQAKNEWILSLDADEEVTQGLKDEIDETLPGTEIDSFTIPRRNYLGDYWVRYGGQYPAAQARLFRKGKLKYQEVEVHPVCYRKGKWGNLKGDIIHKTYRDFAHFLAKLNGQTTLEAKKWIQTNREVTMGRALWRTFDRFPRHYFRKKGRKDGFIGFMFAFFSSLYQIMSYAKYWEMKHMAEKAKKQKEELEKEKNA